MCKPEVIKMEYEYDGRDKYGNVEVTPLYTYNCEKCKDSQCEYWQKFN